MGEHRTAYKEAKLSLKFTAQKVFLVMRPASKASGGIKLYLDGQNCNQLSVSTDKLYELVNEFLDHLVQLFAFTFG